jgi:hypothetical protein
MKAKRSASPPIDAVVLHANVVEWLRTADLSNPGVLAKLRRIDRIVLGRDEGKEALLVAILRAAQGLPAEHPGVGLMLVNCLVFEGAAEVRARLTNDRARDLVHLVAQGRGRVAGGRGGGQGAKHDFLAEIMTELLGERVTGPAIAKALKRTRRVRISSASAAQAARHERTTT